MAKMREIQDFKQQEEDQMKKSKQAENFCFQADCILFGFSKVETVESAISLYQKSVELGNSKAMMALGRIYERGIGGIKVDLDKAFSFYDAAANENEAYAIFWIGKQWEVSLALCITINL